jgi:hypothetical protein
MTRCYVWLGSRPALSILGLSLAGALLYAADDLVLRHPPAAANADPSPFNSSATDVTPANVTLHEIARGSDPLENPSGKITQFGFLNDDPDPAKKTRTEPDENTYLRFDRNLGGPDAVFDYGRRYLFQGHENDSPGAYITRINLDVPRADSHRITLLTPAGADGLTTGFGSIDGSTWNPFTERLLFTEERGGTPSLDDQTGQVVSTPSAGRVIEVTPDWPPAIRTLECIIGKGGWEGIHPDDHGNLILMEDAGGVTLAVDPADQGDKNKRVTKQPNSFVYRFVPTNKLDLGQGGTLYALRVTIHGVHIVFHPDDPRGDTFTSTENAELRQLHTSWDADWVQVHTSGAYIDADSCATASFDANAEAKTAGATPFKRPENGQFLPGSYFNTFFFDETGDTDKRAGQDPTVGADLAARGAWGSIFRVDFPWGNPAGTIRIVVRGSESQSSFDNLAFAPGEALLAAEDRGDTLHEQLNTFDSVWAYDVIDRDRKPRRFLALGQDALAAPTGQEDNEPTGLHISDGATSVFDVLGTHWPTFEKHKRFRAFVTQQHGENHLWEIAFDDED